MAKILLNTIKCQACGKSLTPKEIEVGISVVCPACEDISQDETKTAGNESKKFN